MLAVQPIAIEVPGMHIVAGTDEITARFARKGDQTRYADAGFDQFDVYRSASRCPNAKP